jgi:hypothetical protein
MMASEITVADVKDFCGGAMAASETKIQTIIDYINLADDCLDSRNVPAPTQKLMKLYAVCHQLLFSGGGAVASESDFDGASVSYAVNQNAKGLARSSFGEALLGMDQWGCLKDLLEPRRRYIRGIGQGCAPVRRRCRPARGRL